MSEAVAVRCQKAFLELLETRGYPGVRMAAVAQLAGVSRPTLYRAFHTKEELFRATVDSLFEEFWDRAEPWLEHFDDSSSPLLNQVASAVAYQHQNLLRVLFRSDADALFQDQFRRYFARLIGTILRQRPASTLRQEDLEVLAAMLAGACFHSLRVWVTNEMRPGPDRMAEITAHVFNGRLLDLLGTSE